MILIGSQSEQDGLSERFLTRENRRSKDAELSTGRAGRQGSRSGKDVRWIRPFDSHLQRAGVARPWPYAVSS